MALRGQAALGPLGDEAEPAAMLLAGSHVLGRLEARLEEHGKHAEGAPSRTPTKLPRQQPWIGILLVVNARALARASYGAKPA